MTELESGNGITLVFPKPLKAEMHVHACRNEWGLRDELDLKRLNELIAADPLPCFRFAELNGMRGIEYDNSVPELSVPVNREFLHEGILYTFCLEGRDAKKPEVREVFERFAGSFRTW